MCHTLSTCSEPEGLRPISHHNTADRDLRATLGVVTGPRVRRGQPDVSTKPHPQGPAPCSSAELPVGFRPRWALHRGATPAPQGHVQVHLRSSIEDHSNQNRAQAAGAEGLGRSGSASPPVPAVSRAAPFVATACALVRP